MPRNFDVLVYDWSELDSPKRATVGRVKASLNAAHFSASFARNPPRIARLPGVSVPSYKRRRLARESRVRARLASQARLAHSAERHQKLQRLYGLGFCPIEVMNAMRAGVNVFELLEIAATRTPQEAVLEIRQRLDSVRPAAVAA